MDRPDILERLICKGLQRFYGVSGLGFMLLSVAPSLPIMRRPASDDQAIHAMSRDVENVDFLGDLFIHVAFAVPMSVGALILMRFPSKM